MKKRKSKKWFVKVRNSYLPNSWQGWLTYIPYTAYLILALVTVLRDHQNSTLSKAFNVMVYWAVGVGIMNWIASKKS